MPSNINQELRDQLRDHLKGQIIAHRGAPLLAPENTLSSLKMAAKMNAQWVEFDTQPCASGEWVVIHDFNLERTTNGQGKIIETPYSEIKNLDAGNWFHANFRSETVPLLTDVLVLLQSLGLQPNIEIKLEKMSTQQKEAALTNFCSIMTTHWPITSPYNSYTDNLSGKLSGKLSNKLPDNLYSNTLLPPLLSSFDYEVLTLLQKMQPLYPLGMIVESVTPEVIEQMHNLQPFSLHCNYENLPNETLELLVNKGGGLHAVIDHPIIDSNIALLLYTINSKKRAVEYLEKGVLAIFSDIPNLLVSGTGPSD